MADSRILNMSKQIQVYYKTHEKMSQIENEMKCNIDGTRASAVVWLQETPSCWSAGQILHQVRCV